MTLVTTIEFAPDHTYFGTRYADYVASEYPIRVHPTLVPWGAGQVMAREFRLTSHDHDGHVAAVLADWLEENADEVLAATPGLTRERLERGWADLRSALTDPDRNRTPKGTEE